MLGGFNFDAYLFSVFYWIVSPWDCQLMLIVTGRAYSDCAYLFPSKTQQDLCTMTYLVNVSNK